MLGFVERKRNRKSRNEYVGNTNPKIHFNDFTLSQQLKMSQKN